MPVRSHGESRTRFYRIWCAMKKRCQRPTCKNYADYGGRGIKVCPRWQSFANFRLDMLASYEVHVMKHGPANTSIERKDHNGDYTPANCGWATRLVQMRNTRANLFLTLNGKSLTLVEWSRETGIAHQTISRRLRLGWPIEKALTLPPVVGRNQFTSTSSK